MSQSNEHAITQSSAIRCLEIMISKEGLEKNAGLFWTLSVYSLENEPVAKTRAVDSEVFHFMVFDWKRTIRKLLDNHQVPYSITRFFNTGSVLFESHVGSKEDVCSKDYLAASALLHYTDTALANSIFSPLPALPENDMVLE